jgi:hypothetical protein
MTDGLLVSGLPHEFLSLATNVINGYSVGLIRLLKRPNKPDLARFIGSGSVVKVQDQHGIMTAHHVLEELYYPCDLGLILVEGEHHTSIPVENLDLVEIAVPGIPGSGPDLAYIGLPSERIVGIGMFKQFYDLEHDRDELLNSPPDPRLGVWFVNGIPKEFTKYEPSAGGFDAALSFRGLCGAGGANRIFEEIGFDYIEVLVEYEEENELPKSFGGISGGGLWYVPVVIEDGVPKAARYLLAGTPISETAEIVDGKRTILCHGWKSIYDICYDTISSINP